MPGRLIRELGAFAGTLRLGHTLFALPFALGAAVLADPPWPDTTALALLVACLVTARTAAMGMNRVADARLDAANPRTAGRAIPAGRLRRGTALALSLASGGLFLVAAWALGAVGGTVWPGRLAPAFLGVLVAYSWTKRVTAASHWVLGLCLGLAPVGTWIALRGGVAAAPLVLGAAVLCWTAGFDILYALQDEAFDRRMGLHSMPAWLGPTWARRVAAGCHVAALALLAVLYVRLGPGAETARLGRASLLALVAATGLLAAQHVRAARLGAEAGGGLAVNAAVSSAWLAGVILDVTLGAA